MLWRKKKEMDSYESETIRYEKEPNWNFVKGKYIYLITKTGMTLDWIQLKIENSDTGRPYKGIYLQHRAEMKSAMTASNKSYREKNEQWERPVSALFQEYYVYFCQYGGKGRHFLPHQYYN